MRKTCETKGNSIHRIAACNARAVMQQDIDGGAAGSALYWAEAKCKGIHLCERQAYQVPAVKNAYHVMETNFNNASEKCKRNLKKCKTVCGVLSNIKAGKIASKVMP